MRLWNLFKLSNARDEQSRFLTQNEIALQAQPQEDRSSLADIARLFRRYENEGPEA